MGKKKQQLEREQEPELEPKQDAVQEPPHDPEESQVLAKNSWEFASLAFHSFGKFKIQVLFAVLVMIALYYYRQQNADYQKQLGIERANAEHEIATLRKNAQDEIATLKSDAERQFSTASELLLNTYTSINDMGSKQIADMKSIAEFKDQATTKMVEQLTALEDLQTQATNARLAAEKAAAETRTAQSEALSAKQEAESALAGAARAKQDALTAKQGAEMAANAAADAKADAKKASEEADSLKSKITETKAEYDRITMDLEKVKSDLEKAEVDVSTVREWEKLFQVAALAGDIAQSSDAETAQRTNAELRKIGAAVFTDEDREAFDKSVNVLDQQIGNWTSSGDRSEDIDYEVLKVAQLCRDRFQNAPNLVRTFAVALERPLYDHAVSIANRLAASTDWDAAVNDRVEFKSLYFGKLVFVESDAVATAMVNYREAIEKWRMASMENAPDEEMKALAQERMFLAEKLREACFTTLQQRGSASAGTVK